MTAEDRIEGKRTDGEVTSEPAAAAESAVGLGSEGTATSRCSWPAW